MTLVVGVFLGVFGVFWLLTRASEALIIIVGFLIFITYIAVIIRSSEEPTHIIVTTHR